MAHGILFVFVMGDDFKNAAEIYVGKNMHRFIVYIGAGVFFDCIS